MGSHALGYHQIVFQAFSPSGNDILPIVPMGSELEGLCGSLSLIMGLHLLDLVLQAYNVFIHS